MRNPVFNALRLLIVSGNAVIVIPKKDPLRVFSLHHFITIRDGFGNLLECITKEEINKAAASDEILELVGHKILTDETDSASQPVPSRDDKIEIFTIYYLSKRKSVQLSGGQRRQSSEV